MAGPQREWFEKDYYRVLGVSETATAKEIKSAYRKLSREYHPDTNPGDAAAEERFKEVSAAYDVVGNAERRKEYDEVRRLGPAAAGFPGGGAGAGGFPFQDAGDLGDLLGGLFGRSAAAAGAAGAARTGARTSRPSSTSPSTTPSPGVTTAVHLTSDAPCHTCNGSGRQARHRARSAARTAAARAWCPTTRASSRSRRRARCAAGRGVTIDDPCPTCRGTGVERRPREVKVRVPAGRRRRPAHPAQGSRRARARTAVRPATSSWSSASSPHPLFQRRGRRPHHHGADHLPGGHLGADITVPTLDGGSVRLRIPPGTRSGRTFRVKGKGVATAKGTGDLLATVEVAVPSKLSSAERKALEAFQAASDGASPREHLGV